MFNQSQMIIVLSPGNHLPQWSDVCVCACVFVWQPGPASHRGIHTVAGCLMEPVRGYSRVFCEFKPQQQYK